MTPLTVNIQILCLFDLIVSQSAKLRDLKLKAMDLTLEFWLDKNSMPSKYLYVNKLFVQNLRDLKLKTLDLTLEFWLDVIFI